MTHIDLLPEEMLARILTMVPPLDIVRNVSVVCKRWYNLSSSDSFWRQKHVNSDLLGSNHLKVEFLFKKRSIQSLRLYFDEELLSVRYSLCNFKSLDVFDVLTCMPNLSFLDIEVCMNLTTFNCNFRKEKISAAYGLKSLTIRDHDGVWFSSNAKISSILEGSHGSLKTVKFIKDDSNSLHADEMHAISLCSNLECLQVPVLSLPCMKSRFLREVTLNLNGSQEVDSKTLRDSFVSTVKSNLVFNSVKMLRIIGDGFDANCEVGTILSMCGSIFPNVLTFNVDGDCWNENDLCDIIQQLQFLERVTITSTGFGPNVLKCLMQMKLLRAITGRLYLNSEKENDLCVSSNVEALRVRFGLSGRVSYYSKVQEKFVFLWL